MAINWKKIQQLTDTGTMVEMQAPVIISASRSTDIPAFYCDWFFHRLKVGYSVWTNPFNGLPSYVSYAQTRFIVFWSKNPRPLLQYIPYLKERGINCYIQYSLNDYEQEGLEKGVRPLAERIETFKLLVKELGKGSVIWRFDPLVLTSTISVDDLLRKIENIGDQLLGYTEKLVFSFVDIKEYRKVENNLKNNNIQYCLWTKELMEEFSSRLVELNVSKGWHYELATCGEVASFPGILHNHCVDDSLIARIAYKDKELMKFLGIDIIDCNQPLIQEDLFAEPLEPNIPDSAISLGAGMFAVKNKDNRDKGQRLACGCILSKDIGEYNTCIHACEYCYANSTKKLAAINYQQHRLNPYAETITGK